MTTHFLFVGGGSDFEWKTFSSSRDGDARCNRAFCVQCRLRLRYRNRDRQGAARCSRFLTVTVLKRQAAGSVQGRTGADTYNKRIGDHLITRED
jgi:hypothetical protein